MNINMDERRLSIVVFSLFFSWVLAFPFEGQVLYGLARQYNIEPHTMLFGSIAATFVGLFLCGFWIKTMSAAKRLILFSIVFCMFASGIFFFFAPSNLWTIALISSSFLGGACVAAWGFFFKSGTPSNERIETAADGLIYSNILMILINMTAVYLSPYSGLGLSILMLAGALFFSLQLPVGAQPKAGQPETIEPGISIVKPLVFLCLFIAIITINSGLMYQVINPAFAHLEWLVSWYWAAPYIIALFIMKNLPRKTDRTYILYVAIAMIGLAFIAFMTFDRSALSYMVINTLMLGACGVFDLFWWSILGEMLDYNNNPAKILGVGLSANVLGVLLGGLVGNAIYTSEVSSYNSSALALVVVCVTLIILMPLHKQLSKLLKNHAYLTELSEMSSDEQSKTVSNFVKIGQLTERESEIAALLLKGRTYKMIADELHLSQNTVKTHIKNIYSKLNIQSKMELVNLMMEKEHSLFK